MQKDGIFFRFYTEMNHFGKFIKSILTGMLCFGTAAFADGFDQSSQNGFRYGPNFSWEVMGNTPFVWGQWLPQLVGNVHYTWLEPLETLNYGDQLEKTPTYLRMEGSLEVSPFYGGYSAGLGLRPLKTNPQIEFSFMYENFIYFKSNLEMVTADVSGGGRIAETWNADYVVDNVWRDESAALDYVQLFDFGLTLEYFFCKGSLLGLGVHYVLSDVSTDFEGKSFDYRRNMPVFSRDFLLEFQSYGRIPFNEYVAAIFETAYYRTGYLRSGKTVAKESLGYAILLGGAQFSWREGLRSVSIELGGWKRYKDRFYDGSIAQEFLVQLEYKGYFSFPFHRNFKE